MPVSEAQLQEQVADYLCLQYPDVLFHSDYGSGVKLTPRQAAMQKRQNGGRSKWPDMFIAQPVRINLDKTRYSLGVDGRACFDKNTTKSIVCGLYIELKKEGTRLKKKNGDWATEHIAEQAKVLEDLRQRGYCAEFAVGFDEAKRIIDEYLGGK